MKKIIISLATLAAISSAALANDRSEDFNAAYRNVHFGSVDGTMETATASAPIAVETQGIVAGDASDFAAMKLQGLDYVVERGTNGAR